MRELAEQRRKLLDQQQKEQQAALDSPLVFGGTKAVASSTGDCAGADYDADGGDARSRRPLRRIAWALGAEPRHAGASDAGPSGGVIPNHQQEKEAFLTQAAAVEPYLSKPLLNPISKYELKAGSVIPGALLTAINTDLPGEVIGQVTENVYDTVTGNYLLIPQGSKLLGKYQSLVSNGQNRALVVWQRLIYPNGNSIVLDGMPGTDEAGMAGLQDKVDYHLDKLAEATALTTALAYAGNLARNPNSSSGNNGQDVVGDTVAQQANRIGEKVIDKELDVQPTITIRQGWPLRVLVNKDMVLAPYNPDRIENEKENPMPEIALPAFHETTPVELVVETQPGPGRDLDRYKAFYKQAYGVDVPEADLVREMARRFMEATGNSRWSRAASSRARAAGGVRLPRRRRKGSPNDLGNRYVRRPQA